MDYKKLVVSILCNFSGLALAGCVSLDKIPLAEPVPTKTIQNIEVVDSREVKTLIFIAKSASGKIDGHEVYPYPSEVEVLRGYLSQVLDNQLEKSQVRVLLTSLSIGGNIGFGTNDELYCAIESKVSASGKTTKENISVKGASKNTSNYLGGLAAPGKAILDQCLQEHSRAIAASVLK